MATVSCIDDTRGVSAVRVLVVEDFEPFRRFICSKLGEKPELQVIGEASDGLEAVHKAEELQPDLVSFWNWRTHRTRALTAALQYRLPSCE